MFILFFLYSKIVHWVATVAVITVSGWGSSLPLHSNIKLRGIFNGILFVLYFKQGTKHYQSYNLNGTVSE